MSKYVKTYLQKSGGKEISFPNGGSILKISILESELAKLPRYKSEKGDVYVNMEVAKSKNPTQYSTHSVYFSQQEGAQQAVSSQAASTPTNDADNW